MRPSRLLLALALLASLVAVVPGRADARKRKPRGPSAPSGPRPLEGVRQLVLVTTPDWSATSGTLQRYTRSHDGASWRAVGPRVPALVGAHGLAWGKGLHGAAPAEPVKSEHDGRSPAGAFKLSALFGYETNPKHKLPFVRITNSLECVDDPASARYNTLVDSKQVKQDWTHAEHMQRPDGLYEVGVIIDHNAGEQPVANAGSCTFLHARGVATSTDGGTAIDGTALDELAAWLDPELHPALVQLPDAERKLLKKHWQLP